METLQEVKPSPAAEAFERIAAACVTGEWKFRERMAVEVPHRPVEPSKLKPAVFR